MAIWPFDELMDVNGSCPLISSLKKEIFEYFVDYIPIISTEDSTKRLLSKESLFLSTAQTAYYNRAYHAVSVLDI